MIIIKNIVPFLTLVAMSMIYSCTPMKNVSYFSDTEKTVMSDTVLNVVRPRTIKPYDKIRIQILSIDDQTSNVFNASNQSYMHEAMINLNSYQIDQEGNINFPFVGKIKLSGLTIGFAQEKIMQALNQYVSNTEVTITFVNNKITVLGEVRSPGTLYFYDNKVTIYEAIAGSGGMEDFGRKDNITIVRNEENNVIYKTVDITQKEFLKNEYYYLIPGDIVIVHPEKTKYRRLRDYGFISAILQSVTATVTVFTLIYTVNK